MATSTFNIANFRSKIDSLNGVARTTLFRVEIAVPQSIAPAAGGIDAETLTFLVASVNFPGIKLTTHPVQRYGQGAQEEMPTGFVTGSCDMNILADGGGKILKFFRAWTRGTVEYQSTKGGVQSNQVINGFKPFHVNYKKNIETQITISLYDPAGNQFYKVGLTKAFPTDITSLFLAWSNVDQVMYLPVRFSFYDMVFDGAGDIVTGPPALEQTISVLERINAGGQAVQQILQQAHRPTSLGDALNQIDNTVRGIDALGGIFGI